MTRGTERLVNRLIAASIFSVCVFQTFSDGAIIVTSNTVREFLDGRTGKLIYTKFEGDDGFKNGRSLWYIDFSAATLVEKQVIYTSNTEPRNPIISSDGEWVVYNTLTQGGGRGDNGECKSYVCRLQENATATFIANGAQPHWWVKPGTTEEYVIYTSGDLEQDWQMRWPPNEGGTSTSMIRLVNKQPSGSGSVLCYYYLNAGRTKNGEYMFTSGRATGIFRFNATVTQNATPLSMQEWDNAGCNPSTSPHQETADLRFMQNCETHDHFAIRSVDGTITMDHYKTDDGNKYWDTPEWSTHTDYATVVGSAVEISPPFDVYLFNTVTGAELRVIDGNCYWPHLWVGPDVNAVEQPRSGRVRDVNGIGMRGAQAAVYYDITGREIAGKRIRGAANALYMVGAGNATGSNINGRAVHMKGE